MTEPIKAEPVAWMYELAGALSTNLDGSKTYTNWRRSITNVAPNVPVDGLRNLTPLYTEAQLVEERRLAWNEAIEAAANDMASWFPPGTEGHRNYGAIASIRALTEDSTHD